MADVLNDHNNLQKSERLKMTNEANALKKDCTELVQRMTELQRRLNDMEFTVGQEEDHININY